MQWALVDGNNIVQNIILYDGVSEFEPLPGLALRQVQPWITIGMDADAPAIT